MNLAKFIMIKKVILGAALALSFAPLAAFASVDNVLFDNGTGSNSVTSGASTNMHLYVTSSGQDVESVYVSFPGAGGIAQQGSCYDISPDQIGTSPVGGWNITVPGVVAPVASGVWSVQVTTYGFSGDAADNNCTGSGAMTFGPTNFNGRITVTADNSTGNLTENSGGSTHAGGTPSALDTLTAQVAALAAQVAKLVLGGGTTTTTTASAACQALGQYTTGAVQGVNSPANVKLQGFLLSQGESIPALAAGASFGFYGPQTAAAVAAYKGQNNCQ